MTFHRLNRFTSLNYKPSEIDEESASVEIELKSRLANLWNIDENKFEIVFCQNASNGIRLAAEVFCFRENDILLYTVDNHTSVAGMRQGKGCTKRGFSTTIHLHVFANITSSSVG